VLTFRSVVLWIHLATIIVWIGGMVAIPFVVAPAVRRLLPEGGEAVVEALVRRFQRLSRELVFLVLLTGIFNIMNAGAATGFIYGERFIRIVGTKLFLVIVIAANQAWYSLRLIPRRRTRAAALSATVNVILAAVVLYLGLTLRYG
jgi:uncharacterized membrane protein